MSSAPSTAETSAPAAVLAETATRGRRAVRSVRHAVQFAAFCAAVALPLAYLPLLAGGLPGSEAVPFAGLLITHTAFLLAGHGYGEGSERESARV